MYKTYLGTNDGNRPVNFHVRLRLCCALLCSLLSLLRLRPSAFLAPSTAPERRALLTLFWCTSGPEWTQKSGWQEDDSDLGEWCGVGLDPGGDYGVTLVDLRRNRLSGQTP